MNIIDFFRDAPMLAIIITLAYAIIVCVVIYIFFRLYKGK
jgi:hypothetical protein